LLSIDEFGRNALQRKHDIVMLAPNGDPATFDE
jgi:hypothetical protein